jgi:hypothetical protein
MVRRVLLILSLLTTCAFAAPHNVAFGKPMPVKLFVGPSEEKALPMQVRALYVDGKLREFTTGDTHDVTDQVFVVRRAFRVNDSLPQDRTKIPEWKWQRGDWLMVDRSTGRVTRLNLPNFDPYYSNASWFRDYVAYCGLSDDAYKVLAVVAQLGQKRPIIRKELGQAKGEAMPDSECAPPEWQKAPMRVTFTPAGKPPVSFEVRGHSAEPSAEPAAEEEK